MHALLEEIHCEAEDVVFIAHGTTQATNALLEGDVADIGIVGMGNGIGVGKIKADTDVGDIPLEDGKAIHTVYGFLNTAQGVNAQEALKLLESLKNQGAQVAVASEVFSVDHPENEQAVAKIAEESGMIVTATHELTKLYGLKARTKTAVINASILPKMMQTAAMTEQAVRDAKYRRH